MIFNMTPLRAVHGCMNPVIRALSSTVITAQKPSTETRADAASMRHAAAVAQFKGFYDLCNDSSNFSNTHKTLTY
jgi:hypothetical protein